VIEVSKLGHYLSAQVEKILSNQGDALGYIDKAIELGSGNAEYSEFKKYLLQNILLLGGGIGGQDGW
jgi:hypothetical protein